MYTSLDTGLEAVESAAVHKAIHGSESESEEKSQKHHLEPTRKCCPQSDCRMLMAITD